MAQKDINQIFADQEIVTPDGTEHYLVQTTAGVTQAGELQNLLAWFVSQVPAADSTDPGLLTSTDFDTIQSLKTVATSGSYNDLDDTPGVATDSADGLMSSADKTRLDAMEDGANNYTLPPADSTEIGGVKQGVAVTDAVDETDIVTQFNALLSSLRGAGVIAV